MSFSITEIIVGYTKANINHRLNQGIDGSLKGDGPCVAIGGGVGVCFDGKS